MSNAWKKTLVQSNKQFPTVLCRFLLWTELIHHRVRLIIICDTYIVNISQALQDVADDLDCINRPISAGTPQELGKAESAVGELRRMARATFAAAPHLDPEKYWGLADEWNVWIH